jgi:hypothetical protein
MIGLEEDGIVSISQTDYELLEYELEQNQLAVEMLKWHISKLIEDNDLDELVDESQITCTCDECINTFTVVADPKNVRSDKKWSN